MKKTARIMQKVSLSPWHRYLLVGTIVALAGQCYLTVWADGFRVSIAAILYPILLVTLMRESHRPATGAVTCCCVLVLRLCLDLLKGISFSAALLLEYPGGLFYLIYDCLLCVQVRDRRSASLLRLWSSFAVSDFIANIINLLLSSRLSTPLKPRMFFTLALVALVRSLFAGASLWLMTRYHLLLEQQDHERRYHRLLLMTAELKNELYFLRKSAEETEQVMAKAYHLYEHMMELDLSPEDQALALEIARDVHEVKKDNLRIIRGLEDEVADSYDRSAITLSDLLSIVENSTRHLLGENRADIRLEVRCTDDFPVEADYQLMAITKNLVTNAVEAIQSGSGRGTVRTVSWIEGDQLRLSVEDTGPGISARTREHLFQVGYSTKFDPKTGNIGRGVGLPSVQYMVQDLGGTIEVQSEPGHGARFDLKLPLQSLRKETHA